MKDRISRWICMKVLGRLTAGRLTLVSPDGAEQIFGPSDAELKATIRMHDESFYRAMLGGSLGLGESYRAGSWDCDELITAIRIGARAVPSIDKWKRRFYPVFSPFQRLVRRVPRNTVTASKRHISAHYDLGNDLFGLFLDETMMYSSAYFETPDQSLTDAQVNRMDMICRRLELTSEDHLVEIGSGWGAMAVHAAGVYGCRVTTVTISQEQHDGALERIADEGLSHLIDVKLCDYRDLEGTYDKLVSIEMVEAVGYQYFDTYFETCSHLLKPDGLFLLQAIVMDDRAYEIEKFGKSFANTVIFPGGCLPSVEVIQRCIRSETDMSSVWMEDLSPHYSETLRMWRERFVANADLANSLGYDEPFRRAWLIWLAMSEAGFRERRIRVVQQLFAKPERRQTLAEISAGPAPAQIARMRETAQ